MQEENGWDELVYNLSRIAIIIPILIIVAGVSIKFMGVTISPSVTQQALVTQPSSTVVPQNGNIFTDIAQKSAASEPKVDLKGPWKCDISYQSTKINVSIKDRKIYTELTNTKGMEVYLITNDCLYHYLKNAKTGEKTCGINSWLTMADVFVNFSGISGLVPLLAQLNNAGFSDNLKNADLQNIAKSCLKQDIADTIFIVPEITFKSSSLLPSITPTITPIK